MIMNQERSQKRVRINRPFPTHTLEDVLPIVRTIQDANSGLPMARELLASALGTTASSSSFRMKLTSSAKYNLIIGGYNDENISLTTLGQKCVVPQDSSEAGASLVRASIQPDKFRDFYRLLNGKRIPEEVYARNMLIRELSVHPDLASECLRTIIANGLFSGIIKRDNQQLIIELVDRDITENPPDSHSPNFSKSENSNPPRHDPVELHRIESVPRVFIGFFNRSGIVDHVVDRLESLGLEILGGDLGAEGPSLSLSANVMEAMQVCNSGILVASDMDPDLDTRDVERERKIWLFLGAATFQFGKKVVLVESSSERSSGLATGLRLVDLEPENLDETTLGILAALVDVGAIKLVARVVQPSQESSARIEDNH